MDGEAPRTGQGRRTQCRPNALQQVASTKLAPGQEPEIKVSTKVGDEPYADIDLERGARREGDTGENGASDRIGGALPADQIEPVERP